MPAKPQMQGESDAAYQKRVSNWNMSQERLKSVGIQGGVNKASKEQLDAFSKKYGHGPSGLKPQQDPSKQPVDKAPKPPGKPDMDASNPSKPKGDPFTPRQSDELKAPGGRLGKGPGAMALGLNVAKNMLSTGGTKQRQAIRSARRMKKLASKAPMPIASKKVMA